MEKYDSRCANGHRPTLEGKCRKCGKTLGHADGIHVHDPRREYDETEFHLTDTPAAAPNCS